MAKVDVGVQLLPMTAGSIVLAYNLEGVDNLKLTREAYVGIFLGKITKWNDPKIAAANPDAKLPDSDINVVVRADGSGTTTSSPSTSARSARSSRRAPARTSSPIGRWAPRRQGNDGVAAAIKTTPGSIGYVEYGFAKLNKIPMAALENKAGKFVEPTIASGQAALAAVELPEDMIAWLPDPDGDASYPIVTYTWIICYKKYADAKKAAALKDVLAYGLTEGQKESEALGYIPLPANVAAKVKAALGNISQAATRRQMTETTDRLVRHGSTVVTGADDPLRRGSPGAADSRQFTGDQEVISRPPTRWEKGSNVAFRGVTYVFAWLTVILVLFIVFKIG